MAGVAHAANQVRAVLVGTALTQHGIGDARESSMKEGVPIRGKGSELVRKVMHLQGATLKRRRRAGSYAGTGS